MVVPDKILEEAKAYANSLSKMKYSCPKDVINPGLWYGYIAGAMSKSSFSEEDFMLKDKDGVVIKGKTGEVYFMSIYEILKVINRR